MNKKNVTESVNFYTSTMTDYVYQKIWQVILDKHTNIRI